MKRKLPNEFLFTIVALLISTVIVHAMYVLHVRPVAEATMRADRERMLAATNIAGWTGVNLAEELEPMIGARVIVENDANAACWGEYRYGAGRDSRNMIFLILGTGLGGGLITNGELFRGAHGTAAEFGHMRLNVSGPLCGCGARGCFEQYCAGPALMRHVEEAIAAGITELIFVTGRSKRAIEDHFDKAYELENELEQKNKLFFRLIYKS
mgnify:CR=1 FL=1